jgi:ribosomal-protein-alanine N-acetyltransferase
MTPDEMADIHRACFTVPRPWSAQEIADLLSSPLCFAITAPQGFAIGRVIVGEAELLTLAVSPAAQSQGTGAKLMADFLAEVALRHGESVFLEVAQTNQIALRLYARAGFVQTGKREAYYRAPDAAPISALILARNIA